jgi:uncharacterized protein (DUF736 family)
MDRVTDYQLDQLAKMISEELRWAGLLPDATKVVLDKGSKTGGRAYRIFTTGYGVGSGWSDRPLHLGDGYLGLTKREAWLSLRAILRTLEAVRGAK